ncbi:3-isopropylmalate dehydratase large subunit [Aestuariibius sp. HNIBRBA575]|uniref:3-isopropylmalate dehydratase large subunit n=1 Tax=Aestuariibius sp. HNIBRBA575 TaxID=3233343 RepID=UPI0034A5142B
MAKTLYDKIWDTHVVAQNAAGATILYIDQQFLHEVTSAPAFDTIEREGHAVRRPEATLAVADHNIPTHVGRTDETDDPEAALQLQLIRQYSARHKLDYYGYDDIRQGVVHVVGPEQGLTQPGMTIVCGDSHTSTHGAFGALAFGICTSEIEHVLATQTLIQQKSKTMAICIEGALPHGVTAKDVILNVIGRIGANGATGYVIEFCGQVIRDMSMEARMTVCNMAIEAGARSGLVAPDEKTFAYLRGRPQAPGDQDWDAALTYWAQFHSDDDAAFDRVVEIDAADIVPMVTWGTSPEDVVPVVGAVPEATTDMAEARRFSLRDSLDYMGLEEGQKITEIPLDRVFIGSCTNSRIEDLREVARVVRGRKVADSVKAIIVPGSGLVKLQAEAEGLHEVFKDAGFDWREAGCSMCLGMNADRLQDGERCASTSNRNFKGRQGLGGRTHLVSPAMAAAAAVAGHFVDIRNWEA